MGNSNSSHEPLERGFTRGTYGDVKNAVSTNSTLITILMSVYPFTIYTYIHYINIIYSIVSIVIVCQIIMRYACLLYLRCCRNQLHSDRANDHLRKWIDCANHSEIHSVDARTVFQRRQSPTNGNRTNRQSVRLHALSR